MNAPELAEQTGVSEYGVKVLLDMALSGHLVTWEEPNYKLANLGHFLEHDAMTRANMDFTADVCYAAMMHLTEAIQTGKPAGLMELGDWTTIYEGLSQLPPKAKASWFQFDHFYSDRSFPILLKRIFEQKPAAIYDIGGNTGKWAVQCCSYDSDVEITIIDLPPQIEMAQKNIREQGLENRIKGYPANMLDPHRRFPLGRHLVDEPVPRLFFTYGNSGHLRNVRNSMKLGAKVFILELFWDIQQYDAAALSLNATSLYFTCLANGKQPVLPMR